MLLMEQWELFTDSSAMKAQRFITHYSSYKTTRSALCSIVDEKNKHCTNSLCWHSTMGHNFSFLFTSLTKLYCNYPPFHFIKLLMHHLSRSVLLVFCFRASTNDLPSSAVIVNAVSHFEGCVFPLLLSLLFVSHLLGYSLIFSPLCS